MKKLFNTILLLFPLFLISQELDEAYLNSLPESAREELLKQIDEKDKAEEPTYRRPSTVLDKKDSDFESDKRFGKNFFDTIQSSFMPINEPNLGSSYVLDFGDVLEIQLIGQKDTIDLYKVERDGSINIPDIGKITLSGLSVNDASQLIKNKVKSVYLGSNAYITLKNIRDINVLIAGNAFNPGIYTLNGNSNMLHALSMAGGIDDIGSYRNIHLVRNSEIIDTLDIYDVLIFGKHNLKKGLRSGDSIVVTPAQKIVSIESGVHRPGIYELRDDEFLADLINFANGFNKYADQESITIRRVITEYKFNSVEIIGAVKNPGNYQIPQGTKLSDLIKASGGYTETAYPFGGYLENKEALRINQESKDKLYNVFLNNLIANSKLNTSSTSASLEMILDQIKDAKITGRIIAEFDLDILNNNSSLDTVLQEGDKIIIPNITDQVFVQGEISNPGAIRYRPGEDIYYYINNSGGALKNADTKNIFIVHPNGETKIINV